MYMMMMMMWGFLHRHKHFSEFPPAPAAATFPGATVGDTSAAAHRDLLLSTVHITAEAFTQHSFIFKQLLPTLLSFFFSPVFFLSLWNVHM